MKILITGANGQVGSELSVKAGKAGFEIVAIDRDQLDITRRTAVEKLFGKSAFDLVINAAAYTAVDKAEEEIDAAYAVNRDGPKHLATACADRGIPLFHISTDYVFDGEKTSPYREDDSPNPQGVYGRSKLDGDREVTANIEQQITLRVAWVFGVTGGNFVKTMLRLGVERDQLGVVSDQYGGPTYAGDIADTLLLLAKKIETGEALQWGTYHYTGSPATSWHGFSEKIFQQAIALGLLEKAPIVNSITTDAYPTPAVRPKNSILSCEKIERVFGVKQPDWREALTAVLNRWKNQ